MPMVLERDVEQGSTVPVLVLILIYIIHYFKNHARFHHSQIFLHRWKSKGKNTQTDTKRI